MGEGRTFSKALLVMLSFLLVLIIALVFFNLNVSLATKFMSFFQPRPGSCLILEEKYCKRGKITSDPAGLGVQLVVFKVPSGAVLFSPQEGGFSSTAVFTQKINGREFKYPAVNIISPKGGLGKINESFSFVFYQEKLFKENILENSWIKKGSPFAVLYDRNLELYGEHNLVVSISKPIIKEGIVVDFESDRSLVKELFGN